jgi:hypothetical protein
MLLCICCFSGTVSEIWVKQYGRVMSGNLQLIRLLLPFLTNINDKSPGPKSCLGISIQYYSIHHNEDFLFVEAEKREKNWKTQMSFVSTNIAPALRISINHIDMAHKKTFFDNLPLLEMVKVLG